MIHRNPITLVVVSDNHLVVMLAALLKSIEMSHLGDEQIDIYIVNDGINKTNVEKINRTITSRRITIFWEALNEVIPESINLPLDRTTFPICAYARICAPYFLPQHIEKAIYLDVDMLVLEDIKRLWDIDIGHHTIAAVLDRSEKVSSPWGGIKNYRELGMDPETKYFNSGLLIINLDKWRKTNATQKVIDAVNDNSGSVTFADQYGLNIVFADSWFEIDNRWNCYAQTSIETPFLIHFTGMKPIFKGYNYNEKYKKRFFETLQLTPWNNFLPIKDYERLLRKLRNVLYKKVKIGFTSIANIQRKFRPLSQSR